MSTCFFGYIYLPTNRHARRLILLAREQPIAIRPETQLEINTKQFHGNTSYIFPCILQSTYVLQISELGLTLHAFYELSKRGSLSSLT